jgi:hypothetical protein
LPWRTANVNHITARDRPSAARLVQKEADYFVGIECAPEDTDGPGYFGRSELANFELPCLHAVVRIGSPQVAGTAIERVDACPKR